MDQRIKRGNLKCCKWANEYLVDEDAYCNKEAHAREHDCKTQKATCFP